MAMRFVARTADRCGFRLELEITAAQRFQHAYRFVHDFRADAVTGQDRDFHCIDSAVIWGMSVARRSLALQRFEAGDVAGERACGDRVGAAEPHLTGPGPPRKIAVDRTDRDLLRAGRLARPAVRARAATG